MALSFVDVDGTLVIPQANAKWETAPSNSGIATRGVVVLVGEAETGPAYSEDGDLSAATFGPNQYAQVQAKYGSGNIVDAYRVVANPSRDPSIRGAPSQIICVKTNVGAKAQAALSGGYGVVQARQAGDFGNLLYTSVVTATAEVRPFITAAFARFTTAETVKLSIDGGTTATLDISGLTPTAFVAANAAALGGVGITVSGGVGTNPTLAMVGGTVQLTTDGALTITLTLTGATWTNQPAVGETLLIVAGDFQGAGSANLGSYIITSTDAATIVAVKVSEANGAAAAGTIAVAPTVVVPATFGMTAYTKVTFTYTSTTVLAGLGKSITAWKDTSTTGIHFYNDLATAAPMSITGDFQVSGAETRRTINVNRQADGVAESNTIGGNIILKLGKAGTTTAPVVNNGVTLKGGVAGADWTVTLANFKTLADVAAYISSKASWTATVVPAFSSWAPTRLDQGTFEANSNGLTGVSLPARIKADAYEAVNALDVSSNSVQWLVDPTAGLPVAQSATFLSGGSKGGTTNAAVTAALAAAGLIRGNFIVTLFSQDATADIAAGLTESSSTYDVASVNAALSAHVAQFSAFKKRKPRQGFGSIRSTFSTAKTQAQTTANFRVSMFFQDVKALGSNGLVWFQPWMGAVLAAGMQSAGFYRPLFNKVIAVSGVNQDAGDFQAQDDDQVEQALNAGLLIIRARDDGSFAFVSDQTTYSADDNFVLNSIQAVYVADTIAMTVALRMERAFVGQSFADVTAAVAMSYLKGIMADLKRLKLITASDDAVDGYKDAKIQISPPSMLVSAEVKEATGIYFIPIRFLITQTVQVVSQGG